MLPSFDTLTLAIENHIAQVQLNRPDKANAMNLPMWGELQTCFEYLSEASEVRVVVLSGAGKHFCSGIDLGMFSSVLDEDQVEPARKAEAMRQTILRLQANLSAIEKCRKPVLAAIHGMCVGGGIDRRQCSVSIALSVR